MIGKSGKHMSMAKNGHQKFWRENGKFVLKTVIQKRWSAKFFSVPTQLGARSPPMQKAVICFARLLEACIVLYLYIYIALLAVHTSPKRFQCERPRKKRADDCI